ncbi:MAG: hypothetical protein R2726_08380 [Acidimicrobiales bacterium]
MTEAPDAAPAPTEVAAPPAGAAASGSAEPQPPPAGSTPSAGAATGPGHGGALPTRDELTLAWGDDVLPRLPQKARVRFAGGRWVDVDDAAVFGLPNQHHLRRCDEVRAEAEAALQAHFGRAVPIRLVVDGDAAPAVPSDAGPVTAPDVVDEEPVDPDELVDATDVADRGLDRITELFPGAELVDEP